MIAPLLLSTLLMGLAGSLHCAGMCGPIMWMMPFHQYRGLKRIWSIALYHLGRVSAYAVLGMLIFSLKDMFHPQWQQYVSLGLGLLMLGMGIIYFLPQSGFRIRLPWTGAVTLALGKVMGQQRPGWLWLAGMLNGFLPCGMVYMALAAALATAHVGQAAAVMYAFGAGTLPMMISLSLLCGKMKPAPLSLRKWTPLIMLLFGCLFVLRGANLGIPYLSPKLAMHTSPGSTHTPVLQCCSKPE